MKRNYRVAVVLAFSCALTTPVGVSAVTRQVPSEYATIQAGIDASSEGDTVLVAPGTYSGDGNRDVEFRGADIVLLSESGPGATTIDCEWEGRGFLFVDGESRDCHLEGFTITHGFAPPNDPLYGGGGIICVESSPTISDCVIVENTNDFSHGGGICGDHASPLIIGCKILNNTADDGGGGGALFVWGFPSIEDCTFSGNSASWGGGLCLSSFSTPEVIDCVITGNYAIHYGAGMYCTYNSPALIVGTTVSGNGAPGNSGIFCDTTTLVLERSILWGNCNSDLYIDGGSSVTVICSALDPDGILGGEPDYDGEQVFTDPLFCGAEPCENAPSTEGDYSIRENSPCMPENSPCGQLIGALDAGCGFPTLVTERTWGWMKVSYR